MHPLYAVHHQRQHARLRVPAVVDAGAARRSDPRQASWGANITLRGRPPAILIFAPHKTGSTFFTSFLHDVAAHLGLCWYTDNAAFMYSPSDHTKCASPSCGHTGHQRRFESDDRGWGDCSLHMRAARRFSSSSSAHRLSNAKVSPVTECCKRIPLGNPPLTTCNALGHGACRHRPVAVVRGPSLATPWRHPGIWVSFVWLDAPGIAKCVCHATAVAREQTGRHS